MNIEQEDLPKNTAAVPFFGGRNVSVDLEKSRSWLSLFFAYFKSLPSFSPFTFLTKVVQRSVFSKSVDAFVSLSNVLI